MNPVHVGSLRTAPLEERVRHLRAYAWSSYRGYAGLGCWCGAAVCQQLRRLRERLARDAQLAGAVRQISAVLER